MYYHKQEKMIIDTARQFFKYSIKVRLVEQNLEINELHSYLISRGCKVTITTLSKYLNQKYGSDKSIPADILKQIASFLDTTMEDLYTNKKVA